MGATPQISVPSNPTIAERVRRKVRNSWLLWRVPELHRRSVERFGDFRDVHSVCFVCYGNICRSPAAESFARHRRPDLAISSAGFYPAVGRSSPDYIVNTARTMGYELSGHSSRLLDKQLVEQSDLIVCMDHLNWERFEQQFPEHAHKLVLLGPFGKGNDAFITDPYDRPIAEVEATLATIHTAVEGLVDRIPRRTAAVPTETAPPVVEQRPFLYVSYDFPPARTSAVYRHIGLTRYLPSLGWRPIVICAQGTPGAVEDASLLRDYPKAIDIVRTRWWKVDRLEKWLVSRVSRGTTMAPVADGPGSDKKQVVEGPKPSFIRRFARWCDQLYRSVVYFPDRTAGWIPFAVAAARRHVKLHGIKLVYTSSPPRSAPYIGYLLKRLTGVKWIAEFRDPWYPPPGRIRRLIERRILTRFLKSADGVVLISEGLRDEFAREFSVPQTKLYVVSNGFDESEYGNIPQSSVFPPGRVHFSHFGTIYGGFAGKFFEAVEQLIASDPAIAERLQVNIVGFPDDTTRAAASSPRLAGVVKLWPFMEQSRAIQAMRSSDVLLLFLGSPETSRLSGLGKIYWYLRVGKPVLALAYDGDCKSLILRSKTGVVVPADSVQEIAGAIRELLSEDSRRRIQSSPEVVAEFRYDALASRLANVLREVSSR